MDAIVKLQRRVSTDYIFVYFDLIVMWCSTLSTAYFSVKQWNITIKFWVVTFNKYLGYHTNGLNKQTNLLHIRVGCVIMD